METRGLPGEPPFTVIEQYPDVKWLFAVKFLTEKILNELHFSKNRYMYDECAFFLQIGTFFPHFCLLLRYGLEKFLFTSIKS